MSESARAQQGYLSSDRHPKNPERSPQRPAPQNEDRYRWIVEFMREGVMIVDAELRITFVNHTLAEMMRCKPEDMLGRRSFEYVSPEDEKRAEQFAERRRHGISESFEMRFKRCDGDRFWARIVSTALVTPEGNFDGVVALFSDITESKQAEERLRVSESRFRMLVEQSPMSIQTFAPDGRCLTVNKGWERLWGATPADAADYNILEDQQLVSNGIMPHIQRAFAGEACDMPPVAYVPPAGIYKGQPRWVHAFIYPVRVEDQVREVILCHDDVTAERVAERAIRESEERFRLAVEVTNVGTYDYNLISGELIWSSKIRDIFGVGRADRVTYDGFLESLHPDDRQRTDDAVQRSLRPESRGKYHAEYRIIRRNDGVERWIDAYGQTFFDDNGRALRLIGTVLDVTERKRNEEQLRLSQERLRLTQAAAGIGSWEFDFDDDRFELSTEAAQMLGYSTSISGISLNDLLQLLYFSTDRENLSAALRKAGHARKEFAVEFRIRQTESDVRVISIRGKVFYNSGRPIAVGVMIDVTPRPKLVPARSRS